MIIIKNGRLGMNMVCALSLVARRAFTFKNSRLKADTSRVNGLYD